jgi:hypothetical protein
MAIINVVQELIISIYWLQNVFEIDIYVCSAETTTGSNTKQGKTLGVKGIYGILFIILTIHFIPFYAIYNYD